MANGGDVKVGSLSVLFPAVPIRIGEERLALRPVTLGELPEVERVMEAWRLMVATNGEVLDAEAWEDFLGLLCAAVDRSRAWLDSLPQSEFKKLTSYALAINEEIWKPDSSSSDRASMEWSEIYQLLISHGHPADTIQSYTLAQAQTYLIECLKVERKDLATGIQAAAFSMVKWETVTKVLKELRRG